MMRRPIIIAGILILSIVLSTGEALSDACYTYCCDCNEDGMLSIADSAMLRSFILKDNNSSCPSELKIGLLGDVHWRNTSMSEVMDLNGTKAKLDLFIDAMNNRFHPDIVIQLGDLPDGFEEIDDSASSYLIEFSVDSSSNATIEENIEAISDAEYNEMIADEAVVVRRIIDAREYIESRLDCPIYYVIGNHEYKGAWWNRSAIHKAMGFDSLEDTYYTINLKGYTLIVINTGYCDDDIVCRSNHKMPTNCLEWLVSTLAETTSPTVVLMHVPATIGAGVAYDSFEGEIDVLLALWQDPEVIAAVFAHVHHADDWDEIRTQKVLGVTHYHIPAVHEIMENRSAKAWGELTLSYPSWSVLKAGYASTALTTEWLFAR